MDKEIIIYETGGKNVHFNLNPGEETIWATRTQMAELFGVTPQNITIHLKSIYRDGELEEARTSKEILLAQNEGGREVSRTVKVYNLDVVISVGYRVNSRKATDFRIWATKILKRYIVKGVAVNERRLKELTRAQLGEVADTMAVVKRMLAQNAWTEIERQVVGRAELKLAEAAKAFRYDFRGKAVLDIGSSTGGFTELALRQGAKKVIAVEKGTNQMKAPLRYDPRVALFEKTDFFEVIGSNETGKVATQQSRKSVELVKPLRVDVVLADVSFVSLRKILAKAREIVTSKADYLVMLKPQFEARPGQLNRGVVKNERMRREIMKDFEEWLRRNGFLVVAKRDNETVGKVGGNRERFYWLKVAARN